MADLVTLTLTLTLTLALTLTLTQVHAKNPWLTYGSPLQLARTFGMHDKL